MPLSGAAKQAVYNDGGHAVHHLEQAEIRPDGMVGDRLVQVYDARGHVVTARKHPDLLGHRGTLGPDGEPRIDGWPWASPEAAAATRDKHVRAFLFWSRMPMVYNQDGHVYLTDQRFFESGRPSSSASCLGRPIRVEAASIKTLD